MRNFTASNFKKFMGIVAILSVLIVSTVIVATSILAPPLQNGDSAYLPSGSNYGSGVEGDSLNGAGAASSTAVVDTEYAPGVSSSNIESYLLNEIGTDQTTSSYHHSPSAVNTLDIAKGATSATIQGPYINNQSRLIINQQNASATDCLSGAVQKAKTITWGAYIHTMPGINIKNVIGLRNDSDVKGVTFSGSYGSGGIPGFVLYTTVKVSDDMMAAIKYGAITNLQYTMNPFTYKGGFGSGRNGADWGVYGYTWSKESPSGVFNGAQRGLHDVAGGNKILGDDGDSGDSTSVQFFSTLSSFSDNNMAFENRNPSVPNGDGNTLSTSSGNRTGDIAAPPSVDYKYLTFMLRVRKQNALDSSFSGNIGLSWTNNTASMDNVAPTFTQSVADEQGVISTTANWSRQKKLTLTITDNANSGSGIGLSLASSYLILKNNNSSNTTSVRLDADSLSAVFGRGAIEISGTRNDTTQAYTTYIITITNPDVVDATASPTQFGNYRMSVSALKLVDCLGNGHENGDRSLAKVTSSNSTDSGVTFERYDPNAPIMPDITYQDGRLTVGDSVLIEKTSDNDRAGMTIIADDSSRERFVVAGETSRDNIRVMIVRKGYVIPQQHISDFTSAISFTTHNDQDLLAYDESVVSNPLNWKGGSITFTRMYGTFDIYVGVADRVGITYKTAASSLEKTNTVLFEKVNISEGGNVLDSVSKYTTGQNGYDWADVSEKVSTVLKYAPASAFNIVATYTDLSQNGSPQVVETWQSYDLVLGRSTVPTLEKLFDTNTAINITKISIVLPDLGNHEVVLHDTQMDIRVDTSQAQITVNENTNDANQWEFNSWFTNSSSGVINITVAANDASNILSFMLGDQLILQYKAISFDDDLAFNGASLNWDAVQWIEIEGSIASRILTIDLGDKHIAAYRFKLTLPNGSTVETTTDAGQSHCNVLYDNIKPQINVSYTSNGAEYSNDGIWSQYIVSAAINVVNYNEIGNKSALVAMINDGNGFAPLATSTSALNHVSAFNSGSATATFTSIEANITLRVDTIATGEPSAEQLIKVDTVTPEFVIRAESGGNIVYPATWSNNDVQLIFDSILKGASGLAFKLGYLDSALFSGELADVWESYSVINSGNVNEVAAGVSQEGKQYLHIVGLSGTGIYVEAKFALNSTDQASGVYSVFIDKSKVAFNATMPIELLSAFTGNSGYNLSVPMSITSSEGDNTAPITYYFGWGNTVDAATWQPANFSGGNVSALVQGVSTNGAQLLFVRAVDAAGNVTVVTGNYVIFGNKQLQLNFNNDNYFKPTIFVNGLLAGYSSTLTFNESDLVEIRSGVTNDEYYRFSEYDASFDADALKSDKNGQEQIQYSLTDVSGVQTLKFRALELASGNYAITPKVQVIVSFSEFKWTYQDRDTFHSVEYTMTIEGGTPLVPSQATAGLTYAAENAPSVPVDQVSDRGRYIFTITVGGAVDGVPNAEYYGYYQGNVIWAETPQATVSIIEQLVYRDFDYMSLFNQNTANRIELLNRFFKVEKLSVDEYGATSTEAIAITVDNVSDLFASVNLSSGSEMRDAGQYVLQINSANIQDYTIAQSLSVNVAAATVTAKRTSEELEKIYDGTVDIVFGGGKDIYSYISLSTEVLMINGYSLIIPSNLLQSYSLQYAESNVHVGKALFRNAVFSTSNFIMDSNVVVEIDAEITSRDLLISKLADYSKPYDATTGASFDISGYIVFSNAVENDNISLALTRAMFDASGAGSRTLSVVGLRAVNSMGQTNANYTIKTVESGWNLTSSSAQEWTLTLPATIDKRVISSISWNTNSLTKQFDGNGITGVNITFDGLLETVDSNNNGIPDVIEPVLKISLNNQEITMSDVKDAAEYWIEFAYPNAADNYVITLSDGHASGFSYTIERYSVHITFNANEMAFNAEYPNAVYKIEGSGATKASGVDYSFNVLGNNNNIFTLPNGYSVELSMIAYSMNAGGVTFSASTRVIASSGSANNIIATVDTSANNVYVITPRKVYVNIATDSLTYDGRRQENISINKLDVTVLDEKNNVVLGGDVSSDLTDRLRSVLYAQNNVYLFSMRDGNGNIAQNVGAYKWDDADGTGLAGVNKGDFTIYVVDSEVSITPIDYRLDFSDISNSYVYGQKYNARSPFPQRLSFKVYDSNGVPVAVLAGDDGKSIPTTVIATFKRTDSLEAGLYGNVGTYRIEIANGLSEESKKNFNFVNIYNDYIINNYGDINAPDFAPQYKEMTITPMTITPYLTAESGIYGDFSYEMYSSLANLEGLSVAEINASKLRFRNSSGVVVSLLNDDYNKFTSGAISLKTLVSGNLGNVAANNSKGVLNAGEYMMVAAFGVNALGSNYILSTASSESDKNVSATVTVQKYAINITSGSFTSRTFDGTANNGTAPDWVVRHNNAIISTQDTLHSGVFNINYRGTNEKGNTVIFAQLMNAGTYTMQVVVDASTGQDDLFANYEVSTTSGRYTIEQAAITIGIRIGGAIDIIGQSYTYGEIVNGAAFNVYTASYEVYKVSGLDIFSFKTATNAVTASKTSSVANGNVYTLNFDNLSAERIANPNYSIQYTTEISGRQLTMLKNEATIKISLEQYYGTNYTEAENKIESAEFSNNSGTLADLKDKGAIATVNGDIPYRLSPSYNNTKEINANELAYTDVLVYDAANSIINDYYSINSVVVELIIKKVAIKLTASATVEYGSDQPVQVGTTTYINSLNNAVVNFDFGVVPVYTTILEQVNAAQTYTATGVANFSEFSTDNSNYYIDTNDSNHTLELKVTPKQLNIVVTGGNSKEYDGITSAVSNGLVTLNGITYSGADTINQDVLNLTFTRVEGDNAGDYAMSVSGDNANYIVTIAPNTTYTINKANITLSFTTNTYESVYYTQVGGQATSGGILNGILANLDVAGYSAAMIDEIKKSAVLINQETGGQWIEDFRPQANTYKMLLAIRGNTNINDSTTVNDSFTLTVKPYTIATNVTASGSVIVSYGTQFANIVSRLNVSCNDAVDYALITEIRAAVGFELSNNSSDFVRYNSNDIVNAGDYTARLYCTSPNFDFDGKTTSNVTIKINKVSVTVGFEGDVDGVITRTYDGLPQQIVASFTNNGMTIDNIVYDLEFKGVNENDEAFTTTVPVNAGEYSVRVVISATNYDISAQSSSTCKLVVGKKALSNDTHTLRFANVASTFDGNDKNVDISFIDKTTSRADSVNTKITFIKQGGDGSTLTSIKDAGTYNVVIEINDNNYSYDAGYGKNANTAGVQYIINKSTLWRQYIADQGITFLDDDTVYSHDGEVTVAADTSAIDSNKYGFKYSYAVDGQDGISIKEAGHYIAVLTITSENFEGTYVIRNTYVIREKPVDVNIILPSDLVYSGGPVALTATAVDDNGEDLNVLIRYRMLVDGSYVDVPSAIVAGKYRAIFIINNNNYTASEKTLNKEFDILPAQATAEFEYEDDFSQVVDDKKEYIFPYGSNERNISLAISYNGASVNLRTAKVSYYSNGALVNYTYYDQNGVMHTKLFRKVVSTYNANGELINTSRQVVENATVGTETVSGAGGTTITTVITNIDGVVDLGEYTVRVESLDTNYTYAIESKLTIRKARFTDYEYSFDDVSFTYTGEFYDTYLEMEFPDENLRTAISTWQEENAAAGKDTIYFDNYWYYRVDENAARENSIFDYANLTDENSPTGVLVALPNNGSTDLNAAYDPTLGYNDEMAINAGVYRVKCVMEAHATVRIPSGIDENGDTVYTDYVLDLDREVIWCTLTIKPAKFDVQIVRRNGQVMVGSSPIEGALYRFNGIGEWQASNEFTIVDDDPTEDYYVEIKLTGQAALNYSDSYKMLIVVKETAAVQTEVIVAVAGILIGVAGLIIGIVLLRKKFYTKSRKERKADKKALKKAEISAKKQKKANKKNTKKGIAPTEEELAAEDVSYYMDKYEANKEAVRAEQMAKAEAEAEAFANGEGEGNQKKGKKKSKKEKKSKEIDD